MEPPQKRLISNKHNSDNINNNNDNGDNYINTDTNMNSINDNENYKNYGDNNRNSFMLTVVIVTMTLTIKSTMIITTIDPFINFIHDDAK